MVQDKVKNVIIGIVAEIIDEKLCGSIMMDFHDGNLVNITKKGSMSAAKAFEKYNIHKKTIVIRTKRD